ncbi:MAG: NAD(P)/FAD-dependent oxidoreductase [Desulfobacteraceae bacterium]|nr:NAD(P)/FAD-dependent oxidoreductase [Desulfobacteraceae bacterium]
MEEIIDVVIIGAGPAGLQAAVHAVRKKASVLVVGRPEQSSLYRAHVENYLGVDGVAAGSDLLRIGAAQAERFGARLLTEDLLKIEPREELFAVETESGEVLARTIILATGTSRKKLKVKGEKELTGRGVSYCVDCDANFFRNAKVAVVGDKSAAVDGALTLTRYAAEVHLVARRLDVAEGLRGKLAASTVQLHEGAWVKEILGENAVTGLLLEDGSTLAVEGVFVELGAKGALDLAASLGVQMDMETFSHIAVNRLQETSIPGIYAAGDICGQPYQMAKAVGEGCVAGWEAANYANSRKRGPGND